MTIPIVFGLILALFVIVAVLGYVIIMELGRSTRLSTRLQLVTGGGDEVVEDEKPAGHIALQGIAALGMLIARSGILSRKTLPEMIATNIRTRHLQKVEAGVADALDMLVICADAGLALEAGLARVSQELSTLNAALAQELTQTSKELQIGSDMRRAMDYLGQRTGLDTLKRLSTTLSQSLQYGTPLTQALRTLSAELRQEALVKFEERAGRLPTLMTIPMILFILPCVFLIVAGPAIVNVLSTLHGMK
jgi:tight adherence protein C